ncbi:hypothetical protein ZWY2020_005512 [Hordeum vulgare]|nr:hypothetical protein ZWY2020_005512 [Hordeum vulgare]
MESSGDTAPLHSSPTPTSPPAMATGTAVVMSPCAACKILRRRCVDRCVLAPYFPPTDPHKFATAHRVFGASNIIKLLQDLPEEQRADAVSSMVYEAAARAGPRLRQRQRHLPAPEAGRRPQGTARASLRPSSPPPAPTTPISSRCSASRWPPPPPRLRRTPTAPAEEDRNPSSPHRLA